MSHRPRLPVSPPRPPLPLVRWEKALPIPPGPGLEAGGTPLLREEEGLLAKAEYRNPTGSFKDRGAALVVAAALEQGAENVAADSSGNAALALAALAGRVGLGCDLFVPESCPRERRARLRAHGASVHVIPGPRSASAEACLRHLETRGGWDAGHARNPWFLEGTRTFAWEVWADLDGEIPAHVFFPVGNGTLLLGAARGFEDLSERGGGPALHACQVEGAAPLASSSAALEGSSLPPAALDASVLGPAGRAARGLVVDAPPLGRRVREAVRRTGGELHTVAEEEIVQALRDLARRGHPPDASSAVAWAAARRHRGETTVVALTGGGADLVERHGERPDLGRTSSPGREQERGGWARKMTREGLRPPAGRREHEDDG